VAFAAVSGALGFNLYSYIDKELERRVPEIVEERARLVAQKTIAQALPTTVLPAVEQQVQRQFEKERIAWNQAITDRVASALPRSRQLEWVIRGIGGNVTQGPGQQIEKIDLSGVQVSAEDLARLSKLPGIEGVKVFTFHNSGVDANDLAPLADWPKLEKIDVDASINRDALRAVLPPSVKIEVE
jgi:hypothetical protein